MLMHANYNSMPMIKNVFFFFLCLNFKRASDRLFFPVSLNTYVLWWLSLWEGKNKQAKQVLSIPTYIINTNEMLTWVAKYFQALKEYLTSSIV